MNDTIKNPIPDVANEGWYSQLKNDPARLDALSKDNQTIFDKAFEGKTPVSNQNNLLYVATGGPPLSGKSTLLEQELNGNNDVRYSQAIRVDPDEYTLPFMQNTRNLLANDASSQDVYTALRPGSNIIANGLLNSAATHGYNIAHGTTMTNPKASGMLDTLGELGYTRRILLTDAPDASRQEMKAYREGSGDFHATSSDFINKGVGSAQSATTAFLHADEVRVYWKPEREVDHVLAASYSNGIKTIHDQNALDQYATQYEQKRGVLQQQGRDLPSWDGLETAYSQRFQAQLENTNSTQWQDNMKSRDNNQGTENYR